MNDDQFHRDLTKLCLLVQRMMTDYNRTVEIAVAAKRPKSEVGRWGRSKARRTVVDV